MPSSCKRAPAFAEPHRTSATPVRAASVGILQLLRFSALSVHVATVTLDGSEETGAQPPTYSRSGIRITMPSTRTARRPCTASRSPGGYCRRAPASAASTPSRHPPPHPAAAAGSPPCRGHCTRTSMRHRHKERSVGVRCWGVAVRSCAREWPGVAHGETDGKDAPCPQRDKVADDCEHSGVLSGPASCGFASASLLATFTRGCSNCTSAEVPDGLGGQLIKMRGSGMPMWPCRWGAARRRWRGVRAAG